MSFTLTETAVEELRVGSAFVQKHPEKLLGKVDEHKQGKLDKSLSPSSPTDQLDEDLPHLMLPHEIGMYDIHQPETDGEEEVQPAEIARLAPITLGTATPPIAIASTPATSRSQSRARGQNGGYEGETERITAASEILKSKSKRRKKKRGSKKQGESVMRSSSPAPFPTGNDKSDFDASVFRRKDLSVNSSLANSPFLKPLSRPDSAQGGISALRQQLDDLNLNVAHDEFKQARCAAVASCLTEGNSMAPSGTGSGYVSDTAPDDTDSYEVSLNEDFVSDETKQQDADPSTPGFSMDDIDRKMCAADFDPITCLGKGTFGTVLLVRQRATGRLYAQKMFRKAKLTVHPTLVEQTRSERSILEAINQHPFIVSLHYAFQDHAKLYLVLDYASGGELFTHLAHARLFPEPTAAFYLAELVLALDHLHAAVGVVYRDLKPENCLLDARGHLLLTDFGLSAVPANGDGTCRSVLGTVDYMAPEVVRGAAYGAAVDWWSLGALGFDLLTGDPPFRAANYQAVQQKVLRVKPRFPPFVGPDARDLLTRLLRKDPAKRLGGRMPADRPALRGHRFFRHIDWARLARRELEPPIRPDISDPALAENFAPEFTGLPLSPVVGGVHEALARGEDEDPFGGFSYVASRSVLRCGS